MRAIVLLAVLIGSNLLNISAGAVEQSAPFGFAWGPIKNVPRPSFAAREANITLLTYRRDRLPPNELRDTEEIVLEMCKSEGLQQIVWLSRVLSDAEERNTLEAIIAEGNRRHGSAEILENDILYWRAGPTTVARILNGQNLHRIIMVTLGGGPLSRSIINDRPSSERSLDAALAERVKRLEGTPFELFGQRDIAALIAF